MSDKKRSGKFYYTSTVKVLAIAVLILMFLPHISVAQGISSGVLPVYLLKEGVSMPFPREPTFLGSMPEDRATQHIYQFADENTGLGVTATIMSGGFSAQSERWHQQNAQEVIRDFLRSTVWAMEGKIVSQRSTTIGGAPARIAVIQMDQFEMRARSHTVVIYDKGRLHSWAVQDVPQITGAAAERLFFVNVEKISLSNNAATR